MARFSLKKSERLKKRNDIEDLFMSRKRFSKFPLHCYWLLKDHPNSIEKVLFSVSVPKRNIKNAVDRNTLKRRIRESFRLNKQIASEHIKEGQQFHLMFVYTGKKMVDYQIIELSVKHILNRLSRINH